MKLLKGPFVLKVVALACAVVTYFYIYNELYREKFKAPDPSYKLIKLTAKSLPVKERFASAPPVGYRLVLEDVKVSPNRVTVIGPEALLDEASRVETSFIDLSENTQSGVKKIPLENVAGIHLAGDPQMVEVTVVIRKIEEPQ